MNTPKTYVVTLQSPSTIRSIQLTAWNKFDAVIQAEVNRHFEYEKITDCRCYGEIKNS